MELHLLVLSPQHGWRRRPGISLLQGGCEFVEVAGVGGAEQRLIDDRDFLYAAQRTLELKFRLAELTFPAALRRFGERIESPGDIVRSRSRVGRIAGDLRAQHAGDGSLFDHLAIVPAVQAAEQIADAARFFYQFAQIVAGAHLAGRQPQYRVLEPSVDEIVFECGLVLKILFRLTPGHLIKRRLRDVEVSAVYDL